MYGFELTGNIIVNTVKLI